MAKINLNYDAIKVNGINALDNAINYLSSVINYLQQNSIPNDFNKYNILTNTISDLKKQKEKLVDFKSWLVNSNKAYESLISSFESQVAKLPAGRIKKRTSVVR